MSIASAIQAKQQQVADCYTAISNKGGTLPATQDVANMPTAINSISTGGTIDSLTITPTTSQQTITASGGVDGFGPITVNPVTSAIDANIQASNIKSGISILGVSGSVTELNGETRTEQLDSTAGNTYTPTTGKNAITSITVTPKNYARTVAPQTTQSVWAVPSGYSGHGNITVSPVTSAIDANIQAGNIKSGVSILGVNGNVVELNGETRTVSLTGFGQTFTPSTGKNAITSITVNPSNLARTVNPSTTSQRIGVQSGFSGNGTITVNPVTASIDPNIVASNIKSGVTILSVTGNYGGGGYPEMPSYQITSGVVQRRSGALSGNEFSSITSIDDYGLYNAYYGCSGLTGSIDMSNVISIGNQGLYNAFNGCSGLTGFDLSNLITVSSSGLYMAFSGCSGLTGSVDLSKITSIGDTGCRNFLQYCSGITNVYLNSVASIGNMGFYFAFGNCFALTDIYFNSLKTTSFGSYVNQFNNMFNSTTGSQATGGCTVHFPSNLSSTIAGLQGYPTFGGSSSYINLAFDLTATS